MLGGGGVPLDVIEPCLSPRLMAIGHRLSPLYFFCSPALSSQVSHWYSTLRHRIIYCCQESPRRGGGGGERRKRRRSEGGLQEEGRQGEDVLHREANGGDRERQARLTVKSQPLNI